MVSLVNSHTNATITRWHLWEIDLRFAPGLPPGWTRSRSPQASPRKPETLTLNPEPVEGEDAAAGALRLEGRVPQPAVNLGRVFRRVIVSDAAQPDAV